MNLDSKIAIALVTSIFLANSVFAAGTFSIDSANTTGVVGGTIDVPITVEGLTNFYGFQLDLDFDSSLLSFNSITYSNILGLENSPVQRFCIDETDLELSAGHVGNITCVRTISGEIDPADGTIATVTLNIDNTGSGNFNLNNVLVSNGSGNQVSISVDDPAGTFSTCGSTACTTNLDCDDSDPSTTDVCNNPGTCSASCSNIPVLAVCEEGIITAQCDCGGAFDTGYCCSDVHLESVACLNDNGCDDGNECTIDSCLDGNTCGAACVNTPIVSCGETTPECGDDICHEDESYAICPQDCSAPDDGGEPGGGPGGGGIIGSEGYKAISRNLSMSPLTVGLPVQSNIIVSHGFPKRTAMVIQLHILNGLDLVFFTEEQTGLLDPIRSHIILFEDDWIPAEAGKYEIKVILSTVDKSVNFDIQSHTIEVQPKDTGEDTGIVIVDDPDTTGISIGGNTGTTSIAEEGIDLTVAGVAGLVILLVIGVLVYIGIKKQSLQLHKES